MNTLRWILALPWRTVRFPFRLYRRKISAQLIVSHIMVVLLSIVLLEAALIGLFVAYFTQAEDEAFVEYAMVDYASAAGVILSTDRAIVGLADDQHSIDAADQARLELMLSALASEEPVNEINLNIGFSDETPLTQVGKIDFVLIADSSGTVVASSDHAWAMPGTSVDNAAFPLVGSVSRQAIVLDGQPGTDGHIDAIQGQNRITVASYPLIVNEEMVGVVTLQSDRANLPNFAEFLAGIAVANAFILVGIGLPALLVSVPVGIWRGTRLSKRLAHLAETTSAMGDGDLSRRVTVRGHDEVARVSESFNDMVEGLETTDRARKAFVANVSHELRTPVAIIQGNLERLLDDTGSPESIDDQRRTLETLHRETLTLSRLIDDLFTMARIEETTLPIETVTLHLHQTAAEVVEGIRDVAWEQRKVTVESLVAVDLPPIRADRTRLRQILGNLLYNALRHTPEGGMVVVNAAQDDDMLRISVSDTGVGISPEEIERVFDRFYQVERAGRHAEGSGLGLAIVKQLVEAQGGMIGVDSVAGQGTSFYFTLPLAPTVPPFGRTF